ncbi:MAG: helix-turn-helix domain-containing protein [Sphingomonas fennica]
MAADPAGAAPADEGPPVQPIRFDTAALPEPEQLAAFAAYSPTSRITRDAEGPFHVRSTIWPLDEMILAETWIDSVISTRDERQIRAQPADHYMITVPLSGALEFEGGNGRETCRPGAVLVNDFSLPSVTVTSGLDVLVLSMARTFLEAGTGSAHAHGVLPSTGETRVLIDFLRSLVLRLPTTRMASVPILSRIVRDLLATAIRAAGDPASAPARTMGVRARVRQHIAALPPGEIDLPALMADLGLSRSSLFRAFHQDGGVHAYDRRRRLRMLHRLLVDAADTRSIAELGFACGFLDMPALSRLFRSTFGYTMSDLRRHADHPVRPVSLPDMAISGERYRALVASLS